MTEPDEQILAGGGRTAVSRIGDTVHRQTGPWASSVHALLRHLEAEGFTGAPRVVGSGFDTEGRETLSFIHGVSLHPGPWPDEAMFNLGKMLADFHRASASFVPPVDAQWRPWFGRDPRIIGHGDLGDWNIIAHDHQPVGFIEDTANEIVGDADIEGAAPAIGHDVDRICPLHAQDKHGNATTFNTHRVIPGDVGLVAHHPAKKLIPAPNRLPHTPPIPAAHAARTQGRAGRPWDGGARPVGGNTAAGPAILVPPEPYPAQKRIVTGGPWTVLLFRKVRWPPVTV